MASVIFAGLPLLSSAEKHRALSHSEYIQQRSSHQKEVALIEKLASRVFPYLGCGRDLENDMYRAVVAFLNTKKDWPQSERKKIQADFFGRAFRENYSFRLRPQLVGADKRKEELFRVKPQIISLLSNVQSFLYTVLYALPKNDSYFTLENLQQLMSQNQNLKAQMNRIIQRGLSLDLECDRNALAVKRKNHFYNKNAQMSVSLQREALEPGLRAKPLESKLRAQPILGSTGGHTPLRPSLIEKPKILAAPSAVFEEKQFPAVKEESPRSSTRLWEDPQSFVKNIPGFDSFEKGWKSGVYHQFISQGLDHFSGLKNMQRMCAKGFGKLCAAACQISAGDPEKDRKIKDAYVAVFKQLSYLESSWEPRIEAVENFKTDVVISVGNSLRRHTHERGKANKMRQHISMGLMQISPKETLFHGCTELGFEGVGRSPEEWASGFDHDYFRVNGVRKKFARPADGGALKAGRSFLGPKDKPILDPFNNLKCTLRMMNNYFVEDHEGRSWDWVAGNSHWNPLRSRIKVNGAYQTNPKYTQLTKALAREAACKVQ